MQNPKTVIPSASLSRVIPPPPSRVTPHQSFPCHPERSEGSAVVKRREMVANSKRSLVISFLGMTVVGTPHVPRSDTPLPCHPDPPLSCHLAPVPPVSSPREPPRHFIPRDDSGGGTLTLLGMTFWSLSSSHLPNLSPSHLLAFFGAQRHPYPAVLGAFASWRENDLFLILSSSQLPIFPSSCLPVAQRHP